MIYRQEISDLLLKKKIDRKFIDENLNLFKAEIIEEFHYAADRPYIKKYVADHFDYKFKIYDPIKNKFIKNQNKSLYNQYFVFYVKGSFDKAMCPTFCYYMTKHNSYEFLSVLNLLVFI